MADTDDAILNRNTWANYDCWHWLCTTQIWT
jgi:hypothetical protein